MLVATLTKEWALVVAVVLVVALVWRGLIWRQRRRYWQQQAILIYLRWTPPERHQPRFLTKELDLDRWTLNHLLDDLIRLGYVERSSQNGEFYSLTPEGDAWRPKPAQSGWGD